jgi:hypothetical protein
MELFRGWPLSGGAFDTKNEHFVHIDDVKAAWQSPFDHGVR